ncbi:hypothetical protein CXX84_04345 [Arthrobacter sp. AFG7.2]|uniref:hypothetical protein n=1 Tax=Arthrobacter sp. AFG7.2 TaxID=1688693 RepID=UPI000C9EB950|nr:hypothetical protein [Arthrobacter sp. AFG7.2]PNI09493.1 hypothetical protein CXX84_04345 [Arthrobacter sp. AFG7.2]
MADTFSSLIDAFKNVGVSRAYGSPVQLGGEEVIPVALVTFGFGGGGEEGQDGASGGGEEGQDGASGGGGGGMVLPLGVYRNVGGQVTFRPNTVIALMCLVPVISAVGGAVRKAIRAAKK